VEIINKREFSENFRNRLQLLEQLPALPETAQQLLRLRNNPDADSKQLVTIIDSDPSLAAQVIRYAQLAGFGYGGRITSSEQAVSLVLGFSPALYMVLGLATAPSMKIANTGPLARTVIWQQGLATAALCQELSKAMPKEKEISSGLAYLSGLFHNFGYLLFGHFYPEEYRYLNEIVDRHPNEKIRALELHAFGISHDMIGMWLMRAWKMPEEICTAVAEHHFPDYEGKHADYAKLIALANRLLNNSGMGDSCSYIENDALLESLGISQEQAQSAMEKIQPNLPGYSEIAKAITA
jgi:HD-like signal output (HDOD) protein